MITTVVCTSMLVLFAISTETVCGLQCYQCFGLECEANPSNKKTCNPVLQACFQGYGVVNNMRIFGRTCTLAVGPNCVDTTCRQAPTVFPQLQGLTNCNGKCCDQDLCNGNVTSPTTAPPTTAPTNQSTPTGSTAATPGAGAVISKASVLLFIIVLARMVLL